MREVSIEEAMKIAEEHKFTEFRDIVKIKEAHIVKRYNMDVPELGRFVRAVWRVQLEYDGRTVWISSFDQAAKEIKVDVLDLLSSLRADIDLLFDITDEDRYEEWREMYVDMMGKGNGDVRLRTYRSLLINERKMRELLGEEMYIVFLYCENDW